MLPSHWKAHITIVLVLAAAPVAALHGQDQAGLAQELRRILRLSAQQALEVRDDLERNTLLTNIAVEQFRAGDFQGALETQKHLPESDRAHTLSGIAMAQAQIGELAAAARTAATIQDNGIRAFTLSNLAVAHARRRDFQGALAIAAGIVAHPEIRLRTYRLIAHFQFRAGDKPGAARTLREAFVLAKRELADPGSRSTIAQFVSIAWGQSQVHDVAGAAVTREHLKQILAQMPDSRDKEYAFGSIARAFAAAGESLAAREMIARMKPGYARDDALALVAITEAQASNMPAAQESMDEIETPEGAAFAREQVSSIQSLRGETPGALETASAIPDPAMRAEALMTVADEHARREQPGPASIAMTRALEAAALAGSKQMKPEFYRKMAAVQAHSGDLFGALETSRAIQDEPRRADALSLVTTMQAKAGDWRLALSWAEEETSPLVRAHALFGVAVGLAEHIAQANATKR